VYRWAIEKVGLDAEDATILKTQKVDGETLLTLTKEELIKSPYNMPGGPATKLARAIKELKNDYAKRIACMCENRYTSDIHIVCISLYFVVGVCVYVYVYTFILTDFVFC
jgi:hypothetical protein